jgi:glyoxylase-like metal-dependent hydrolase (beta-lactamase superfamily II)
LRPSEVAPGVHRVALRGVNVFLLGVEKELVLIDAGLKSSPPRITEAIYSLRRQPHDVRAIVVTHAHRDHVGGLAEMLWRTGAEVWMHPADGALVREGFVGRPLRPGPGRGSRALVRALGSWPSRPGEPVAVAHEVNDGEVLPFDGLRAVHTPGHSPGHIALLLPRDGGVLFAGDAVNNWLRLSLGSLHEDRVESRRSLEKLAALDFEVACPAHGRPVEHDASAAFRDLLRRVEPDASQP